jgi:hypothetical protein
VISGKEMRKRAGRRVLHCGVYLSWPYRRQIQENFQALMHRVLL